jgi:excisionase family DNA binding protein
MALNALLRIGGAASDDDADPPEDRWMTLAEIAAELRMSPATIRSWVSQGTLQATRAGRRKWLVRRSELDRLLAGEGMQGPDTVGETVPEGGWRAMDQIQAPHRSPHWPEEARAKVRPESWLRVTDGEWQLALVDSAMAPPDPDFVARIRTIAEASARKAAALENLEEEPGSWWRLQKGPPNLRLSYELRPAGNRPGPPKQWRRFDRTVEQLSEAMEHHSVPAERLALERLSLVLHEIADELVERGVYPWLPPSEYEQPEAQDDEDGTAAEHPDAE